MKYIISTFLLAVSASSNVLLGNISTTNYNNQVAGLKTTKLPLVDFSFQVDQEVRTTTNCNNQGDDLDCYLMMDPTTLEEGAGVLGEGLGVFGKKATSAQTSVGTTSASRSPVGNSSSSVTGSGKIDTDAVAEENSPSVECARGSTNRWGNQSRFDNYFAGIAPSSFLISRMRGPLISPIACSLQPITSVQPVFLIATKQKQGTGMEGSDQTVVDISVISAEARETIARVTGQIEETKQALARASAKIKGNESYSWLSVGESFQAVKAYKVKAIEAQEVGKAALAGGYREAATTSQRAADQWRLAAQTFAAGKGYEGLTHQSAGVSFEKIACDQGRMIEMQEAGKEALAAGYQEAVAGCQEAAEALQRAVDQRKESAQAKVSELERIYSFVPSRTSSAERSRCDSKESGGGYLACRLNS
ncbi:MAG: hypothetical protein A3F67_04095 [Verrucomicrobia bacterium RIFCSPHIGHO2_12_FULL_41_10]|nr:MAG: hypothetical protein A3F67_04095 [Verrucomicrobia bacterium RIFCSPHIGHO2_12_FULL_41_10]HLB33220.1 hypothetical protein [Chthoniobacterales bacterium]